MLIWWYRIAIDAGHSRRRKFRSSDRSSSIILVAREAVQRIPHASVDRPRLRWKVRLYSQSSRRLRRRSSASIVHGVVSIGRVATAHVMGGLILHCAHRRLYRRRRCLASHVVKAGMVSAEAKVLLVLRSQSTAAIQPKALATAYRRSSTESQLAKVATSIGQLRVNAPSTAIVLCC